MIGRLTSFGQWLKVPVLLLLAVFAILGLWRLFTSRGSGKWLRSWLAGKFGCLRRRQRKTRKPPANPLAGIGALTGLPPNEAVINAYGRLLCVVHQLGYPRNSRDTPYDVLQTVQKRFRFLEDPARRLTTLYVRAAYSEQQLTDDDRQSAVSALGDLGEQMARRGRAG